MKEQILQFITETTYRPNMEDVSTKQIAAHFNIATYEAYRFCNELATEKKITKLDPVNGNSFTCCGWINND